MKARLQSAITSPALIVIVALAVRLAFFWSYQHNNPRQALSTIPFLFESGNVAHSIATGHGFSSPFHVDTGPTAWMTPVYPYLLAGIFRVFGEYTFQSFAAAALVNILATAFACVPIFYAGKRVGGAGIGATAAWLWAVFPNAFQLPTESMWDASIAALLVATIVRATLELAESQPPAVWIGYGLLWGLTLMTSATLASLLPLLLGWLAYRRHKLGIPWLTMPLLAGAVAALCCVPWTVRNYEVFHSFVPLRSILGLQLWVGNNPEAQDRWLGTHHPIHDADERAKYVDMGEIDYMQEKKDDAIDYMLSHPAREAHLIGHRFLAMWSGGTPNPVRDFLRARSWWFRFVLLFNIFVAIGTLWGLVALIRRRSEYWLPLAVFPVVFPWAYYLTIVQPRYRLPIDPVLMLLTAIAIGEIARIARRQSTRSEVPAIARA
jgi:4-amino-4-deoxy-L-arabinose transferase-like glycosyltransferase